ncbi:MAG: Mut7-C RNAse domain-containing protein [Fusobacteriota bacterium]
MKRIYFRFFGNLNYFFKNNEKVREHKFKGKQSVKDRIETVGVPHTEVEHVIKNGKSLDFSYIVQDRDMLDIYPKSYLLNKTEITPVRKIYKGEPKFILDVHLGKLANYLRMIGIDTQYRNDLEDEELANISVDEGRILLTRDTELLKRSEVVYGYYPRSTDPKLQAQEIIKRYKLSDWTDLWSRCISCNGKMRSVTKEEIIEKLEPKTKKYYSDFHQCVDCKKVYWKGSHFKKMEKLVDNILDF